MRAKRRRTTAREGAWVPTGTAQSSCGRRCAEPPSRRGAFAVRRPTERQLLERNAATSLDLYRCVGSGKRPQPRFSMLHANRQLADKLDALEEKYDAKLRVVFDAIRELMTSPSGGNRRIGFQLEQAEMDCSGAGVTVATTGRGAFSQLLPPGDQGS